MFEKKLRRRRFILRYIINECNAKLPQVPKALRLRAIGVSYHWGYLALSNLGGDGRVKKETLEYIRGERNALKDELILSREFVGNSEYICVSLANDPIPLYKGFVKRVKRKNKIPLTEVDVVESKIPKRQGWGKPYIMVMQHNPEVFRDLSIDALGLLFRWLVNNHVDWTDGRLIYRQGRGRKKHPMNQEYIAKEFKIGKRKLKEILSELSTANILRYDRAEKAYFVNREFIKKGSASQ